VSELPDIEFNAMDGTATTLGDFAGSVLMVVNVASKCGMTPQYEALQNLYEEKHADGLEVLGFPANNFGGQEPGTDQEIADFCSTNYNVSFPVFSKISVTGADKHPLYSALTEQAPPAMDKEELRARFEEYGMTPSPDPEVLWNFEKFVIGRDGKVVARFSPSTTPDDPKVRAVIEAELAKSRS
jgi:glutathione peroxidase